MLSETMARESYCPPVADRDGYTLVCQAHLRQCATAVKNLWDGSIYDKSLEYLIRYLLVAWLAPERAAVNKERSHMYIQRKAAKNVDKNATSHQLRRSHWRHSMRRLCDKMAACIQNDKTDGIERLTGPLQALYSKKPAPGMWDKQPIPQLPPPPSYLVNEDDNEDDNEVDLSQDELDKLVDDVETELRRIDEDAHGGTSSNIGSSEQMVLDEPDTSSCGGKPTPSSSSNSNSNSNSSTSTSNMEASEAVKKKEPNQHTLRRLQALIKVLLESPSEKAQFDLNHIKQSVFKGCSFSEEELQVAHRIINFLRPFVPRRWKGAHDKDYHQHTPHITLRAPLAIITNAVLRLLGRTKFTRRIVPSVAVGEAHGVHLGAAQLFDVLCSSSPGHYDVVGVYGDITNVYDVASPPENKNMVFKGFFNMDWIELKCRKHGFQFGQRYSYLSFQTHHAVESGPDSNVSTDYCSLFFLYCLHPTFSLILG